MVIGQMEMREEWRFVSEDDGVQYVMRGIEKRKEKSEPVHFHRMYDNQIMPLKISSRRLRKPKTKAERGWWHGRRGEEEKGKGPVEGKK